MTLPDDAQATEYALLAVTVNGARDATASLGWPLELEVRLLQSRHEHPAPEFLSIEVTNAACEAEQWPWRLAMLRGLGPAFGTFEKVLAAWTLDPASTARIAPGRYTVTVTIAGSDSDHAEIELAAEAHDSQEWRSLAQFDRIYGNFPAALERLESRLAEAPDDTLALKWRAEILEESGRKRDAVAAWDAASRAARKVDSSRRNEATMMKLRSDGLVRSLFREE